MVMMMRTTRVEISLACVPPADKIRIRERGSCSKRQTANAAVIVVLACPRWA